jgi:hypothetical protein
MENKKPSRKIKYLKQRFELAEKAVDQYSKGILSPLEQVLNCDPKVLLKSWTKTRDELKQELLNYGE